MSSSDSKQQQQQQQYPEDAMPFIAPGKHADSPSSSSCTIASEDQWILPSVSWAKIWIKFVNPGDHQDEDNNDNDYYYDSDNNNGHFPDRYLCVVPMTSNRTISLKTLLDQLQFPSDSGLSWRVEQFMSAERSPQIRISPEWLSRWEPAEFMTVSLPREGGDSYLLSLSPISPASLVELILTQHRRIQTLSRLVLQQNTPLDFDIPPTSETMCDSSDEADVDTDDTDIDFDLEKDTIPLNFEKEKEKEQNRHTREDEGDDEGDDDEEDEEDSSSSFVDYKTFCSTLRDAQYHDCPCPDLDPDSNDYHPQPAQKDDEDNSTASSSSATPISQSAPWIRNNNNLVALAAAICGDSTYAPTFVPPSLTDFPNGYWKISVTALPTTHAKTHDHAHDEKHKHRHGDDCNHDSCGHHLRQDVHHHPQQHHDHSHTY